MEARLTSEAELINCNKQIIYYDKTKKKTHDAPHVTSKHVQNHLMTA